MLALENVDLADLALALEDHSSDHTWWLDRDSGAVAPRFIPGEDDGENMVRIAPLPSGVGYGDMEDFVAQVRAPKARESLERAIVGRGAFRRFKDELLGLPELRTAWFGFHDARGERRALEWLDEQGIVERESTQAALARLPQRGPGDVAELLDGESVAHHVAEDLRRHYGERLREVLLVGPWARGEGRPEVDLRLLVVLDEVTDRWAEKRAMDDVLWRHSVRNDTVVTASPVASEQIGAAGPLLASAMADGVRIR